MRVIYSISILLNNSNKNEKLNFYTESRSNLIWLESEKYIEWTVINIHIRLDKVLRKRNYFITICIQLSGYKMRSFGQCSRVQNLHRMTVHGFLSRERSFRSLSLYKSPLKASFLKQYDKIQPILNKIPFLHHSKYRIISIFASSNKHKHALPNEIYFKTVGQFMAFL